MVEKNKVQIIREFSEPNEEDERELQNLFDYLVSLVMRNMEKS